MLDNNVEILLDNDDFLQHFKLLSNVCRAANIMIIVTSETHCLRYLPIDICNNIFTYIMTTDPSISTIGSVLEEDDYNMKSSLNTLNISNIKLGNTQAIFRNRDDIRIFDVRDL